MHAFLCIQITNIDNIIVVTIIDGIGNTIIVNARQKKKATPLLYEINIKQ